MPVDLFADFYKWTVTAGGTTAPTAGASETWTVNSGLGVPAATTGVSQFRVVDLADQNTPPEIMIVTNVSSLTWTVTRGGEGSQVPWAHAANWTAIPVLTAGGLINGSGPQATIAGTTAGTVTLGQPIVGAAYKKVVACANGYRNSTATAQTWTYPTPFINVPAVISDGLTGVSSTATALSLPTSMGIALSGTIIVEGF
jgi:hypothetical protein